MLVFGAQDPPPHSDAYFRCFYIASRKVPPRSPSRALSDI